MICITWNHFHALEFIERQFSEFIITVVKKKYWIPRLSLKEKILICLNIFIYGNFFCLNFTFNICTYLF